MLLPTKIRALCALSAALITQACGETTQAPQFPFVLERSERGEPVSDAERTRITEMYLELLEQIPYFQFIDQRAHGVPMDDPEGRYGYSTWWSGVRVIRNGQTVVFDHPDDGSDNNGLRTAPMIEGACFATALWEDPQTERLLRKMIRGMSAWIMAMERSSTPDAPVLLSRAFYPPAIQTNIGPLEVTLDYSDQRPGLDNPATEYVHLEDNPHWGDIWIKNKRSKDDIGHMMRAIGQLSHCEAQLMPDTQQDLQELRTRYSAWARQVEQDGFTIGTYDKSQSVWYPPEGLAIFIQAANTECNAMLTMQLFGRGQVEGLDCDTGISEGDLLAAELNDHNRHIFLSFHAAAANHALLADRPEIARKLALGLGRRFDDLLDAVESGESPGHYDEEDMAGFIAHAANAGMPLTWREVRFLHRRVEEAHARFLAPENDALYASLNPEGEDGEYGLKPGSDGFKFRELGVLLGSCASHWFNPTSKPVLDCAKVAGPKAR